MQRRDFFKTAFAALGLLGLSGSRLFAKTSQKVANYQESPKNGEKCATCFHYNAKEKTCKIVKGQDIPPKAWCKFYTKAKK